MTWDDDYLQKLRRQFPALSREVQGRPAVFADGPAGTQVPQRVIDAMADYLAHRNANHGGVFATSVESDAMLEEAHRALADFLGTDDPGTVSFGPNMTTLTFALSRSLSRRWRPGDEVIVTRLDHDANVSPWTLAAQDAGATVKFVEIRQPDCTLDLEQLRAQLSPRTRLVAVGCASNATGTINPVRQICEWARAAGALTFLDAVHYAPHAPIDVAAWNCDFLACSTYKFFGPHQGVLWGRRELLEELVAYKVRPATDELPGKWMTGTQSHESIAGALAAVEYLADIGRSLQQAGTRRQALQAAMEAVRDYERGLIARFLAGLATMPEIRVWGITDPRRFADRLPTVSLTHPRLTAVALARQLAEQGIFVWHGNYYALQLTETLGLEPEGMVRIGFVHYNTADEVDRVLQAIKETL